MSQVDDWDFPPAPSAALVVLPAANNMIKALRDSNSGASEPADPVAGMLWFDTSAGVLKVRNSANSQWIIASRSGRNLIQTVTATNVASVIFNSSVLTAPSGMYEIEYDNVVPDTENVALRLRTSTNNGASFDSGASDYLYARYEVSANTAAITAAAAFLSSVPVTVQHVSTSATNCGTSGTIKINGIGLAQLARFDIQNINMSPASTFFVSRIGAQRQSMTPANAIKIEFGVGLIKTGTFSLYEVIR